MEHSGRASQPKLSSKDHNVNPTGLTVLPNIKNVLTALRNKNVMTIFKQYETKIQQHLRLVNVSREPLAGAGVYHIPWPCGEVYIGATNT